jgi:hypothetical protein
MPHVKKAELIEGEVHQSSGSTVSSFDGSIFRLPTWVICRVQGIC